MKGFDILHVKSAVKSHNDFDLSKTHLTTMNIGQIVPLYCEELVPGDKFQVNAQYFSRMAPLVKPTYGKISFKTVTGFVPYYMIAEDADAWLAGKTTWEGQTPNHRWISMRSLFEFVNQNDLRTTASTSAATDYVYIDASGSEKYCKLTQRGKYYVKILNSLGYQIPNNVDLQSGSTWSTDMANVKLSAYPILAFAKLYNDYMSQSQRFNTSMLSTYLTNVKFGKTVTGFVYQTGEVTRLGLNTIFSNLFLNYENDYFTSAWQSPNTALYATEGPTQMVVPSNTNGLGRLLVGNDDNELQVTVNPGSPSTAQIGQRALDFLKSFDDWVRRNNYSGSRVVQQIYSRFGIKTDDYRAHYAQVIDTKTIPIQVGDVTSTSNVSGQSGDVKYEGLGDYAGKGIVNGDSGFQFKSSDYGLLLILGYYTVTPMNSFGFDKRVLRNDPLSYYQPEFDGLGAECIEVGQFYTDPDSIVSGAPIDTAVYGYTERYNSYRYPRDVISGEFRSSAYPGMDVWHTGRYLTDVRNSGNLVAQSSTVCTMPPENNEYDRIFGATGNLAGDRDKFYMTAQFRVKAVRPMLSLNQVPRLGEGDTVVPRNGNVIS